MAKSLGKMDLHTNLVTPSCCQDMRVCQRGWAGRPWARNPKTPHFYWLGLGRPGPPQPLTFIDGPGPARLPKALTFIDGPWARPAHPNPSLLSTGPGPPNPSLLLARPLTSISQARRRNPGVTPASVTPALHRNGHPLFPLVWGPPSLATPHLYPCRRLASCVRSDK